MYRKHHHHCPKLDSVDKNLRNQQNIVLPDWCTYRIPNGNRAFSWKDMISYVAYQLRTVHISPDFQKYRSVPSPNQMKKMEKENADSFCAFYSYNNTNPVSILCELWVQNYHKKTLLSSKSPDRIYPYEEQHPYLSWGQ